LEMVVVYILFQRRPFLSAAELSEKHRELLDDQHITQWLTTYSLKTRVRGLENPAVLDQSDESRLLFHSYVGAVYMQKGLPVVLNWISRLVCPESEPLAAPGNSVPNTNPTLSSSPPPYSSSTLAPAPPSAPPPPMLATPAAGGLPPVNALSLFNQTCSQRGIVINWDSEAEGPPHQPRWAVKCLVNGMLRGAGTGRNQKVAKEEAARQAFQALGWGSL
jgi:ribonuclease-3